MDKDIRTYILFIGLPAALITAAGLSLLVFGASGLASEMRSAERDVQFDRYERNLKARLATKARAYGRDGEAADHVWSREAAAGDTNFSERVKYGWFRRADGAAVVGWVRLDDGTVIGYDTAPFRYEDNWTLYLFGTGVALILLLFFVLFAGGGRLVWSARKARRDLEVKDSFLDMISHELNTPLGSIVPLSSALASGVIKDPERRAAALATVKSESARMARMIGELLTAVRLRNGKISFARDRFDVREAVEAAVALVRERYRDCAIAVESGDSVFAVADRDKVEQVAINLIENACRYAGEKPIEVSCRECGGSAVIEVMDRGVPIPRERMGRLFERFYQDGTHEGREGLGLGLSIVSGFVRGMGGGVRAVPRSGGGNAFTVTLPGDGGRGEGGDGNG